MTHSPFKATLARAALATLAAGAALATVLPGPAKADPMQYTALHGVGSDTIQDVANAFSGFSGNTAYEPITAGSTYTHLASWDATGSTCITTKIGGPSFDRPNGSGNGVRALSRALDGGSYGTVACGGAKNIAGQVNFARSSSQVTTTSGPLTHIPFARDGVSFAYYRPDGNPVTTLTKAELADLYTNGPKVIGGVYIVPCGIQTGSGTFNFWNSTLGVTSTETDATATCNAYLGRAQENDAVALQARGVAADAAHDGAQVIIGFSAAAFIAKSNLATADPAPPAGVGIGSISNNGSGVNLGSPVGGTAPNLVPRAEFYNDTAFGRFVYNVVSTNLATGPGTNAVKSMFVGAASAVCQADDTVAKFGFLPLPDAQCGTTNLRSAYSS